MRISLEEVDKLSKELAEKVREYNPECVISIRKGGYRAGEVVANSLEVPHYSIKVSRWCSDFVSNSFVQYMCNQAPLVNGLCRYMASLINRLSPTKLREDLDDNINLENRRILLVDDVEVSGKTIRIALKYLRSRGLRDIKTAVIRCEGSSSDYWVTSEKIDFPWEI